MPVGPIIKMFFGEICGEIARARAVGCAHACMAGAVRQAWSAATHLLFQRRRHTLPPPAVAHRDRDGTLGFRLPDNVPVQLLDDLLRPQRLLQCHLRRLIIRSCCRRLLDGDLHFRLRRRALAHTHAVEGEGRGPKAPRHYPPRQGGEHRSVDGKEITVAIFEKWGHRGHPKAQRCKQTPWRCVLGIEKRAEQAGNGTGLVLENDKKED